jgi:hypothetical protein
MSLARSGAILLSDDVQDTYSPLYANKLNTPFTQISASVSYALGKKEYFDKNFPAGYLGRIDITPTNLIIGDPDYCPVDKLLDIGVKDWWGTSGFLTSYDPKKLFTILEMHLPFTYPVAVSAEAAMYLSTLNIDFLDASKYTLDENGGFELRRLTRRNDSADVIMEG